MNTLHSTDWSHLVVWSVVFKQKVIYWLNWIVGLDVGSSTYRLQMVGDTPLSFSPCGYAERQTYWARTRVLWPMRPVTIGQALNSNYISICNVRPPDVVSLALFLCTSLPRCYKSLQDIKINLCMSHCSCQIHDACMRLSYNDVFKFYILLIRISQVFCPNSMNNAPLTPVKLPSSMMCLLFVVH